MNLSPTSFTLTGIEKNEGSSFEEIHWGILGFQRRSKYGPVETHIVPDVAARLIWPASSRSASWIEQQDI